MTGRNTKGRVTARYSPPPKIEGRKSLLPRGGRLGYYFETPRNWKLKSVPSWNIW
jgi:hypothetical protein